MQQQHVDWYESWFGSPYYPILYNHRDVDEAKDFVKNLIHYLQPPVGSTMADIACGEGRHSRQLAAYGFEVIGTDLAAESIQIAKKYETDKLQFFVHDMRSPLYMNYFDFAFNFFTSFGYFEKYHDHELAAKAFASCLKQGGTLIIDYLNKENALKKLVANETVERDFFTFYISRKLEQGHFIKNIQFEDENGRERHFHESVAAFTVQDFKTLFHKAGLKLVTCFGDYDLSDYNEEFSPRMIMFFKK
jgi:SAM-dependent methyltransferase